MITKKRFCFVIPSLQVGGMERVMSELTRYFCMQGELEVHLILFGRKPEVFYPVPHNLIIHKPQSAFNDKFRFVATLRRMIYLRITTKSIRPTTVLSFGEYWNSFVILALFGLKYPIFVSDRCSPQKKFSIFHSCLRRWLYPKSRGIIVQTDKAKQIFSSQFRYTKLYVIGNPIRRIDYNVYQQPKENIVLTVGRLINSKHQDSLIRIFSRIYAPEWKLIIVGDDALKQNNKERLSNLIKSLNSEGKIILAGVQADIDSYYLRSKIFAFMSSSEGFPNVIGEAMAAGLPVIASDCIAGPSEMISNNVDGLLIPMNNDELYQSKLEELIKDESLRNCLGSQASIKMRKFSIENIGSSYYKVLIA